MKDSRFASIYRFRDPLVLSIQAVVIAVSLIAAFWIRLDFSLNRAEWSLLSSALIVVVPAKLAAFLLGGLRKDSWRYATLSDLVRIGVANAGASVLAWAAVSLWVGPPFPRAIYVIDILICFLLSAGARYSFRLYNETLRTELTKGKNVLIYGAGSAGRTLLREVRTNHSLGVHVLGFIDDNLTIRSMRIMDVPVLGCGREIARIVERYRNRGTKIEEVIIAMPSATSRNMREAHASCRGAGVPCRTIPGLGDLLSGKYLSAQLRNLSLEDLLGREQIRLEEDRIQQSITGKRILVTGAAGSIGSELCRQIAAFTPSKLIALDQAESELFKIDQELRHKYPNLEIVPIIGDIRDIRTVEEVVRKYSIESIYHAAAYKHVPMMEAHILEAVRNNVLGTRNLVDVARRHRVSSFVMISSDKAVNPSSVMGLTKRIAELIASAASNEEGNVTNFVSVRFGNVLESNGSVVPTFRTQIATGGPVTVTHPDMRRYFMSIREAVQLVLQASTMGKGSNTFVLDMGEPVRILDLAHNMIQLAGFVPNEDIEIRITGLRPGEKLFEEIALEGENVLPTYHEKIRIFKGMDVESAAVSRWLSQLESLIEQREEKKVLQHLSELVPEYKSRDASKHSATEVVRLATSNGVLRPAIGSQQIAGRSAS
jgi:FlaA1/EpsC-like NDP-sugar epimerase